MLRISMALDVLRVTDGASDGVARDLRRLLGHLWDLLLGCLFRRLDWRRFDMVCLQGRSIVGAVDATGNLLVNRFRQQFLAEGAEQVRLHNHFEPELLQELALHPVEFAIAQDRKELCQGGISHWLILPHLVRQQQRSQE